MSNIFMLYREGGGAPTVKHTDRDVADHEADRIARTHGGPVYVLQAVAKVEVKIGKEFVEKLMKKEVQVSEIKKQDEVGIVAGLTERAKGALKDEIPTVAWMTAARAAIDRSAPQIGKVLVKAKVVRAPTAEMIVTFVKSDLGSGIYGFAAGTILSAHPRAAKKPWLGMIAKHMRMEGLARIGTVLVDPLLTAVERVLLGAVEESGIDVAEVADPGDER